MANAPALTSLAGLMRLGAPILTSWITIPEPLIAEATARAGFDCVTLDMQHGLHDPVTIMRCIGAVSLTGCPTVVRIPVGDFAMASRALDMGAAAVIAPMINSAADCAAFIAAVKYPPLGQRSWGAGRAIQLAATDPHSYLAAANADTVAFAMIETVEALQALDEILAVPGLDAVFVGPSDLSIALSNGASVDPMRADNQKAAEDVLARAHALGKRVGTFAITAEQARHYRQRGYDFIALSSDAGYLATGAGDMLKAARLD